VTAHEAIREYNGCDNCDCLCTGDQLTARLCFFDDVDTAKYQCTREECEVYRYCLSQGEICEDSFVMMTFKEKEGDFSMKNI